MSVARSTDGAQARGVGREVDRERAAVQPPGGAAVAVGGAETLGAQGFGEPADRGVAAVVDQDHDQLHAFGTAVTISCGSIR